VVRRKTGIKIAVIGAGSPYTPMIVRELLNRQEALPVEKVCFFDIDHRRLSIVTDFCKRLVNDELSISSTRSVREAVDGADFVLSQFRVGQLEARHRDIKLGLKYGLIGQETTGVGGFAKALRTIPVTLKLCRTMRKYATKNTWLINFTNPSAIVTEAILKYGGVQCIGLCNGPWGIMKTIAHDFNVDLKDVRLDYVGTNHLGWVRGVHIVGNDCTKLARRKFHGIWRAKNIPDLTEDPIFESTIGLPYNGYLHYYYYTESMLHKIKSKRYTRAQEALAIQRVVLKKYANPGITDIPDELSKRGGSGYNIVAVNIIEAIVNNLGNYQIVNTANNGAIAGVLSEAVVEITCCIGRTGAKPVPFGAVEPQFRGLLQVVKAYEELTVEAGVKGDLSAALHALVIHPLGPTADKATTLLKELIKINHRYLPQFSAAKMRKFFKK